MKYVPFSALLLLLSACGSGGDAPRPPDNGGVPPPPAVSGMSLLAGEAGGFGNIDGKGELARLNIPAGLAFDAEGNLYIAERGNHAIRKMTPQGVLSTVATGFRYPSSVAADRAGNLYVWDVGNGAVRKIAPSGEVTRFADLPVQVTEGVYIPMAQLTIDSSGALYATDPGKQAIVKITTDGQLVTLANTSSTPAGIARDAAGNVYFGDGNAVRRLSATGTLTTLAGKPDAYGYVDGAGADARFNRISALAVSDSGDVLVADMGNSRVRKIAADGTVSTLAGRGLATFIHPERDLVSPGGIALSADGKLYISDTGNHVIRKANADGSVDSVAGLALPGWSSDASDPGRKFDSLSAVAADKTGNIYLAEYRGAVYKISSQGALTKLDTNFDGYIEFMTVQEDGLLHVESGDSVYRITKDGHSTRLNPYPRPDNEVLMPRITGLAPDGRGGVYVVSRNGMHNIAQNGAISHLFSIPVMAEGGLAVDANGNYYVSGDCVDGPREPFDPHGKPSRLNCSVFRLGANGSVTTLLDGRSSPLRLRQPVSLALDPASGNLYVAERNLSPNLGPETAAPQIHRITPQGQVSTVAGSAALRGFKQGPLPASLPDYVTGMAVQGNSLYVATPQAALRIVGLP
jgi:sugar lactone lactonase YvrE